MRFIHFQGEPIDPDEAGVLEIHPESKRAIKAAGVDLIALLRRHLAGDRGEWPNETEYKRENFPGSLYITSCFLVDAAHVVFIATLKLQKARNGDWDFAIWYPRGVTEVAVVPMHEAFCN